MNHLEQEDEFLRDLLENCPSYIDYNDDSIIAYDEYLNGYTAKQLKEMEIIN